MIDKNLLNDAVNLAVEEAKFDCSMQEGRGKNTEETSRVALSFSRYIWSLESLINDVNFDIFVNGLFSEVNSFLVGTQDFETTINNILEQKRTFTKKFLA